MRWWGCFQRQCDVLQLPTRNLQLQGVTRTFPHFVFLLTPGTMHADLARASMMDADESEHAQAGATAGAKLQQQGDLQLHDLVAPEVAAAAKRDGRRLLPSMEDLLRDCDQEAKKDVARQGKQSAHDIVSTSSQTADASGAAAAAVNELEVVEKEVTLVVQSVESVAPPVLGKQELPLDNDGKVIVPFVRGFGIVHLHTNNTINTCTSGEDAVEGADMDGDIDPAERFDMQCWLMSHNPSAGTVGADGLLPHGKDTDGAATPVAPGHVLAQKFYGSVRRHSDVLRGAAAVRLAGEGEGGEQAPVGGQIYNQVCGIRRRGGGICGNACGIQPAALKSLCQ